MNIISCKLSVVYRRSNPFVKKVSYATLPEVIILDCDDTDAQAYGPKQLTLFNSYYGGYCFIPLHIYEGLTGVQDGIFEKEGV